MSTVPAPPPAALPSRLRASGELGPTVSFELYPPRSPGAAERLWQRTLPALAEAAPDFLSVTYGASGSSRETSREVVRWVAEHTAVRPVAHLTCIGSPRDELREVARGFLADGVQDFLALRGDPPAGTITWTPHPEGLQRASELVELLLDADPRLGVGVAATPSCLAPDAPDAATCGDLLALRAKQDAGAGYAITQVFFEVESYTRYVAAARAVGVHLPLVPGLVPLTDPNRLRRLEEISGVPVPGRILAALDAEPDEAHREAAGLAMGAELVDAVLAAGAPGVHLYTFNQAPASLALLDRTGLRPATGRPAL
ncbi:methylenetetrahydrofolate reductase [Isoptericola sp. b490]|uniref:methylenetetrahydrofolate reductase n=1 Tax=Actinotalea lenta TaxID=3064654 RepID=UPI00271424ED|nr:methylenetetrahydrofolate reductase [Isoptericola sp. b490]MDO8122298.1 methylenetetrahydrofolate reductase [Isoptericola sp. b490]